jgi:hypothetical protein
MPRSATATAGQVTNITYENLIGVGQNANFLSGRAPGNVVSNITLRNVTLTIDRWSTWNYSHPDHDYRPTTAVRVCVLLSFFSRVFPQLRCRFMRGSSNE